MGPLKYEFLTQSRGGTEIFLQIIQRDFLCVFASPRRIIIQIRPSLASHQHDVVGEQLGLEFVPVEQTDADTGLLVPAEVA